MDVAAQAANGYRAAQLQTQTPRGIEAKLFAEITAALVRTRGAGRSGFGDLAAALHRNRTLWDALLADLALEANGLPVPLKAQLIQLGHFVRQFTAKVLKGDEDVQTLIDVNTAILEGLRGARASGSGADDRP
jgi:flagellar protein FlaF